MKEKQRIDIVLYEQGFVPSREKARAMIMAGEISLNGQVVSKPGTKVDPANVQFQIKSKPQFVSRGGDKLAHALRSFNISVEQAVCADVGASTGGFTDCLLQNNAGKVYAIDVGYGQLDYALRQDKRVIVLERTNARYLESLPEKVDKVVIDASFISLRLLLPVVKNWLKQPADIIPLIKPQFEAGRSDVGKGGVVKDHTTHLRVLRDVLEFSRQIGLTPLGLTISPLKGPAGNIEFLALLGWGYAASPPCTINQLLEEVSAKLQMDY